MPGGYRKIVIIPNHIEWEIMYYNDYQVSLIHGDLDTIKNNELPDKLSGIIYLILLNSFLFNSYKYLNICFLIVYLQVYPYILDISSLQLWCH